MANEDQDLVSQIKVEGGEASASEVEQFANRGAAAFEKLNASAAKGAAGVGAAARKTAEEVNLVGKSFDEINRIKFGPGIANSLKSIENNMRAFTGSLRQTTQAVGRFAGRVALLGAAAQTAAVAFAVGASKIAKSADGQSTSLKDMTDRQIEANTAAGSAEQQQIQLQSTQRGLLKQLAEGKIGYAEYGLAIRKSNDDFREQQRVANEVANAQARVKEENDRLQKSLAQREAMNKLIDTFGGPLTSALVSFGRQAEATRQSFLSGFGPGIAALVNSIGAALANNSTQISAFFDTMGSRLQKFVSENGPAIQLALENIGKAGAAIFEGLLAAGPPLLDFFNNQLVPAFQSIGSFFTGLAETINSVFGTKLTGGFLVIIGLALQLSGGLRLIFAILKTGVPLVLALGRAFILLISNMTPLGIAITFITGLLIFLLTKVDWSAWATQAQTAFAAIGTFMATLGTGVSNIISGITAAWNGLITFFAGIPATIGALFVSLWGVVTELANAAVQTIIGYWNSFVAFVTGLPEQFAVIWAAIGQSIVDAFSNAVTRITTFFSNLRDRAFEFLKPILDMLQAIASLTSTTGGSGGAAPQTAAGGRHIRGPRTSTSDSIPAWLSDNEFVIRAAAVRKYGVSFMNAINQGRFKMPKFALGGQVSMISPQIPRYAFADGGPVQGSSAMRPLNLSLFGEEFNGLMMPDDVANRMTKFAIARQTRSAGRKPAWVGGTR
jgi:hypothetical protein